MLRTFAGFSLVFWMTLCLAGTLFGQYRIGVPIGPGNAVFPAGTPATNPSITRFTPNAVHPASGVPRSLRAPATSGTGAVVVPYAYPVYVTGSGFTDGSDAPAPAAVAPQQPTATAVYTTPVPASDTPSPTADMEPVSRDEPPADRADDQHSDDRYLIALKDHTIYSVVAYWVEGDTLHFFTSGNVHNQDSLSLVDRDLTARLNKESGMDVDLPPAK